MWKEARRPKERSISKPIQISPDLGFSQCFSQCGRRSIPLQATPDIIRISGGRGKSGKHVSKHPRWTLAPPKRAIVQENRRKEGRALSLLPGADFRPSWGKGDI